MAEIGPVPGDAQPFGLPPTVHQAAETLFSDFRGSFPFSQGEGTTQYLLFLTLDNTYKQLWTPEGMHEVLPEALETVHRRAVGIIPPAKHHDIPLDRVQAEASAQWQTFSEILTGVDPVRRDLMGLVFGALRRLMPFWDARQVILGRYNRPTEEERYESYYRTYVLEGQPTGSEAFDIVFASLRKRQLRAHPPMLLKFLQAAWELRHDEPFYPESFRKDLKSSPLLTRLGYVSLTRGIPHKVMVRLAARLWKPRNLQTGEQG